VMRELACELIVVTPAFGEVSTTSVCVGCPIEVASRRFKVNLICLPIKGLDVILGMDWLASNHVVLDCGQCRVVFPDAEGLELISSNQAEKEIEAGATFFMIVAQTEKKSIVENISLILVVDEYANVFLDKIPELPPSRDVDFTIDLIPGLAFSHISFSVLSAFSCSLFACCACLTSSFFLTLLFTSFKCTM